MIQRVAKWYASLPRRRRLVLEATAVALAGYGSALLSSWLATFLNNKHPAQAAILVGGSVLLVAVVVALAAFIKESAYSQSARWEQAMNLGRGKLSKCDAREVRWVSEATASGKPLRYVAHDALHVMDLIVDSLYETLTAMWAEPGSGPPVRFEVTFMCKSYRDPHVTVAAYANDAQTRPLSMKPRQEGRKDIYDTSVTAELFRSDRPYIRIIEDTADPREHYHELYDGQVQRIRSSVVYPVLAGDSSMIGALVAHCDRKRLFRRADEVQWRELLEIFGRRLALEKERLDSQAVISPADAPPEQPI